MGLDMYLHRQNYVKNWDFMKPAERHTVSIKKGKKTRDDIKPERIAYVTEEVGYWRKFNALHSWFVENVQNGDDNCGEYYVDRKLLEKLLEDMKSINNDKNIAEKVLPTSSGFFFGGTEYDDYYFSEIQRTIQLLEELLAEKSDGQFYYTSSW